MVEIQLIFLDSWIWLEFFTSGSKAEKCFQLLSEIRDGKKRALMSAFSVAEIYYRLAAIDERLAQEQIHLIEVFPNVEIIPVFVPIAKLGAQLRKKYYGKEKQVSYGDMINLATAVLGGCSVLYSGDPDFEGIDELTTVVI